jgi:acetylornithine/N-succinyldiaminopimelate aminotransferase
MKSRAVWDAQGDLLACHTLNFQPDILTLSKPLAGGLPLSATLIPKKVNKAISIGDHGTTFGGGPVTTAVAGKVWEIITSQGFLDKVKKRAEFLHSGLFFLQEKYAFVSDVKGLGLLAGLAFTLPQGKDSLMGIILSALRDKGLLALRAGTNVLRLAPPLTVKKKEIEEALAIIDLTLSEVQAEFH